MSTTVAPTLVNSHREWQNHTRNIHRPEDECYLDSRYFSSKSLATYLVPRDGKYWIQLNSQSHDLYLEIEWISAMCACRNCHVIINDHTHLAHVSSSSRCTCCNLYKRHSMNLQYNNMQHSCDQLYKYRVQCLWCQAGRAFYQC